MTPTGQTETSPLQILLLGPPLVTRDGQIVHINRRELRAGLYYLAGHAEPVSRAEICYTFWPDAPEDLARKKLREGLSRLRTALKDPDIIISNNDFVSLDFRRVYVDVVEYSKIVTPLLKSSELNGNGILPEWIFYQLRKAVEICRGHQFLQEASLHNSTGYDAWVSISDQSFAFSYEKILERLAEHSIAKGNIDEAMLWLGKVLSFDHFNADASFLMLNCMCERRRFKEAADYLSLLNHLYYSQQKSELPDILKEMQKKVVRETFETKPEVHDAWPMEETNLIPFVGRSELLSKLFHAYHRKGLVHVTGESGSGKTRLVREFYARLEFTPRLLFCVGKPMVSSTPYAPIVEGLNRLLTEKEWLSLPDELKTNLHSLYPAIKFSDKRLSPIIIEKLSDNPALRIQNALYSLFKIMAEKKPLMMVLDIAQWCDDATLHFLTYLNERQFFKNYGLLILISRIEEPNPSLEAYLDQSVLSSNLERMRLEPFSLEETSQVISMELGKSVSEELLKKVQSQTGGNPYLLIETLKALDLYNIDYSTYSALDHFPVPASIRAIVNEKIRALSESARLVLSSAAVLGQRFQIQVLEKMVKANFEELLSALEELEQAQIIISVYNPQQTSYYEFPRDQFREVIIEELSPARKRGLHLASVRSILEVKGKAEDLASTYAWHYEQAGEHARAFSEWCIAAEYSRNCFSKEDAYAAYQRALNLLPELPAEEGSVLLRQLLLEWGNYAYDLQDQVTCEKLYKTGLEYGEARREPLLIGISISGLGRVAEMNNDLDEGIELHQRALFFLSKTDDSAEKVETYARLGLLYELKNEFKKARETYKTGMQIEINYSDMRLLDASVNLKSHFSILASMMGFPAQAEEIADQAINESRLINRLSGRVHAFTALAIAQYYTGKYQKSMQCAFTVYKQAEQLGLVWWASLLDIVIARDYLVMGQLDESWHYLHHSIEKRDPELVQKNKLHHHVIKGDIFRLLGDMTSALEQYRQGAQPPLSELQSLESYFAMGLTLCQGIEYEAGLKILKEGIEKSANLGLESISLTGRVMWIAFANPKLDEKSFIEAAAPYVDELKRRGFGTGGISSTIVAGGIALRRGDLFRARKYFLEVAEAGNKIGHRWYELWAVSALASMDLEDKVEVLEHLERKKTILNDLAAHAVKSPLSSLMKKFSKLI